MFSELLTTTRVFDIEDLPSVHFLNDATRDIAKVTNAAIRGDPRLRSAPLIREEVSHLRDEIQAADVAAGWARDLIVRAGIDRLGSTFERVWVNGMRRK